MAAAFAGACGDDDGGDDKAPVDSGNPTDATVREDAGRDAGGMDASTDAGRDAGTDAGKDAGPKDAGPLAAAGNDKPTLSKVGFYNDDLGRRILIAGSDKNGDIDTYTITFYSDAAGNNTVDVDTDGDGSTPGSPTFTLKIAHDTAYADFFAKFAPSQEVITLVRAIKVKVTDVAGNVSDEKLAKLEMAPQAGSSCDPSGFNRCATNSVCSPNANNDTYSCLTRVNARQQACAANAPLTLAAPGNVTGELNNASFWDWPSGCVGGDTMSGFPDRVVKVTLAAPATKLTLSTGGATGTFDSVLYQLPTATPACKDDPAACGDNGCNTCSDGDLVLNNVPAGDLYIVVDKFPPVTDTTFTLTATVE
ncbi:MAG TPA: hypothetical protein VFX59_10595 [Polyangiales bacterium]|nr:hypothetical protein [Polyangiales bacterium]